jgi:hypothetical protein
MTTAPSMTIFDDILDFLASTPTPEQIIAFNPPDHLQQRLSVLLESNHRDELTAEDRAEFDEFLRMNRFMSRLKLRARQKLTF